MTNTDIRKGLEGVVVDTTRISKVMPEINALTYYGYPVQDLAEHCRFEEVAYLLWNGDLPTQEALLQFEKNERSKRPIGESLKQWIKSYPSSSHPMDSLRTSVSYLGLEDTALDDTSDGAMADRAMNLFAKIPTLVAADFRSRKGLNIVDPRADLNFCENFLYMCFGHVPSPDIIKAFDVSMTLYAEHGFNASTFTARVITSSLADMFGAITGAIASLKGPLHGGANEAVMHMMLEIGHPDQAKDWMLHALATKRKIMGFGHRVYKNGDSRVPTMKKYFLKLAEKVGNQELPAMYRILEDTMVSEKNIHPNLDFPAGPAYYLMGFDIDFFTPLFVISRITGWTAHVIEQWKNNRLIRPLSAYTGPNERKISEQKMSA